MDVEDTSNHIGNTYGSQNLVIRSQGKVKIAMDA